MSTRQNNNDLTGTFQIVDYSAKAVAIPDEWEDSVFKDEFKAIGGRYTQCLTFGAGWIFSKKKHLEQLEHIFAFYELTDMVRRISLEDIGTTRPQRTAASEHPGYILTGGELKNWVNTAGERSSLLKSSIIVLLPMGFVSISLEPLETEFLFGYSDIGQGMTVDEAKEACEKARTEEYFIQENTKKIREDIARLKRDYNNIKSRNKYPLITVLNPSTSTERDLWRGTVDPDTAGWENRLNPFDRMMIEQGRLRELTEEERERLIVGYEIALSMQEKRAQNYLKRYGVSKIKADIIWNDR